MGFTMPARGVHTRADNARRERTAPPTTTPSVRVLSPSSTLTRPAPSPAPSQARLRTWYARGPAATAAVPRHREGLPPYRASKPGLYNLAEAAGDERNHLDAVGRHHHVQRPRDGAAHQRPHAKFRQAHHLLSRQVVGQDLVGPSHNLP